MAVLGKILKKPAAAASSKSKKVGQQGKAKVKPVKEARGHPEDERTHARPVDKETPHAQRRGSSAAAHLFCWPQKVAGAVHQVPKLNASLSSLLRSPVVIYSDHSGLGNGEEGLIYVLEVLVESASSDQQVHHPLLWSCCDPDAFSQEALTRTSRAQHLFSRVEDQVADEMTERIQSLIADDDDSPRSRLNKILKLSEDVSQKRSEYFPGRKAKCLWQGKLVDVRAPVAKDNPKALEILISGAQCQDWSAMNKAAPREAGVSQIVFTWWIQMIRDMLFDVIFHENVMRFDLQRLRDELEDLRLACLPE